MTSLDDLAATAALPDRSLAFAKELQ